MMLTENIWYPNSISQWTFIASIAVLAFIYFGYPVLSYLASRFLARPVRWDEMLPSVSIIIAARNEEKDIAAKIENALSLDYPKEKYEIIVASDASTDNTDSIVKRYESRGVIIHRQEVRQGKTVAQQRAVRVSSGEVLVFSDATTLYESDVLKKIVRNFADPEVGCVAGQLVYYDRNVSAVGSGCRSYWGYEKFLKYCESRVGSLIGVSGCLYAVRRSCYAKLPGDMIDDFVIATEIHLQGLRTVYEPEAIAAEDTNHRGKDEIRMRIRVIEQTMSALRRYRQVLNLFTHGMFAWQMICHKVMRYTVPVWLLAALIASGIAAPHSIIYKIAFLAQAAVYGLALLGWIGDRMRIKLGILSVPYYFMLVNYAIVIAFVKFLRGDSHVVWEPLRNA